MPYKETIEVKNLFFFPMINSIGGVETFFYNLARKYKNNDILIVYCTGDASQIRRLKKYVRVEQFKGQDFICEKAFFNYSTQIIDCVKADEYIQIIHADYEAQRLTPNLNPKITRFLCVSEHAKEAFEKVSGVKTELAYNPLASIKPKRVLKLISATRLTAEKGKQRILKLCEVFDANHIPFTWTIYTNDKKALSHKSLIFKEPELDICDYVADADYLVQLSDSEAYCYSVVEALTVGTPVIVTPCPVFEEIGVISGVNGFYIPFDLSDVPVKDIYEKYLQFEYKAPADNWKDILAPGKSEYQKDLRTMVSVEIIRDYFDMDKMVFIKKDAVMEVNKIRAQELVDAKVAEIIEGESKNGEANKRE